VNPTREDDEDLDREVEERAQAYFRRCRRQCDFLQLWRHCALPACRRARACVDNPSACYRDRVSRMPETARVWVQAGIDALDHGASARAAAQIADRALLSHLREREGLPRYPPRRRLWRRVKVEEGQGDAVDAGGWPRSVSCPGRRAARSNAE